MFKLTNVDVTVTQRHLLKSINLDFKENAITTILGANGAGKSTLFKTLLGEYQPQKGQVYFAQQTLASFDSKTLSLQRAYIAQKSHSLFNMLTIDYLILARLQYQESEKYSQNLVLDVAKKFAVTHLLMRDITQLSGGESQIIEFTRAYLQLWNGDNFSGKCMLLDEPASALDIKQTQILYQHLSDFCQAGGTVIIIDHNINDVSALASQVVLLKNGEILANGPKHRVFTQANLDLCFETQGQVIVSHLPDLPSANSLLNAERATAPPLSSKKQTIYQLYSSTI